MSIVGKSKIELSYPRCRICPIVFPTVAALERHVTEVHGRGFLESALKCPRCGTIHLDACAPKKG